MKKITISILLISLGLIIYFFIREQFNGVVLSGKENILLSILYLVTGICALILTRMKSLENKRK